MQPEKDKPKKKFFTRSTIVQKIILVAILLLILANDIFLFGGNIRFYARWAGCGQKPVAAMLSDSYIVGRGVPNHFEPPDVALFRMQPEYYCTPLEAERAGYSSNPDVYEFENLPRGQWQEAIGKSKNL